MNSVKPISQDGTSNHCQCSWDSSHSEGVACIDLVVWHGEACTCSIGKPFLGKAIAMVDRPVTGKLSWQGTRFATQ